MSETHAVAVLASERALAEHFYRAACAWAKTDGEPVEALVFDRFLVAAQDWQAAGCFICRPGDPSANPKGCDECHSRLLRECYAAGEQHG